MSIPFEGSLTQRVILACTAPGGLSQPELRAATGGKAAIVSALIGVLIRERRLFKGGVRRQYRYFATETARDAYEAEHAAEIGAVLELRSKSQRERDRIKYRKQSERRKAQRAAEGKTPRPKLSPEERRQRKADSARTSYERKRKKLGLTVKHRDTVPLRPAPEISNTSPRKATSLEGPRGRGIVIAPSKFKPPKQIKPKQDIEPVITSATKVTICPHYEDRRFRPDPSIAGRGAISADWMEERLKLAQGKGPHEQRLFLSHPHTP